jgi:hypothetical protein
MEKERETRGGRDMQRHETRRGRLERGRDKERYETEKGSR